MAPVRPRPETALPPPQPPDSNNVSPNAPPRPPPPRHHHQPIPAPTPTPIAAHQHPNRPPTHPITSPTTTTTQPLYDDICSPTPHRVRRLQSSRLGAPTATRPCGSPRPRASSGAAWSTLEQDPARSRSGAGTSPRRDSTNGPSSSEGTRKRRCLPSRDGFDVVFLDAWKDDYELLFGLARGKLDPGGVVVADNVHDERERARVRGRAPGRPDARLGDGGDRTRPRGRPASCSRDRRPAPARCGQPHWCPVHRRCYGAPTAERRWSGVDSCSTGSGGTSG